MNRRLFSLLLATIAGIALGRQAFAQAGNDNPGGPTAEYHGSITTGGHYDPFTGNAKREITDIVVPGSVGAYPLKYTRTFDTRGMPLWTNNYQWSMWVVPPDRDPGNGDGFYDGPVRAIQYPNGGHFDDITYDSPWDIAANGPQGASDQLVTCSSGACTPGSAAAYELWRADGGKVLFQPATTLHSYQASKIIDPFGQATTLAYNGSGKLWKVTEPGGRYLELLYTNGVLSAVRADDGRGNTIETVSYGYDLSYLNHAYYDDGAQATYTYAEANSYPPPIYNATVPRVLHTCDDPRYAGPMKYIEYEYVSWTEVPDVGRGQIKAEKNVAGQVVSRTSYPTSNTDPNLKRRTETRGDGPSRTFDYAVFGSGVWSTIWRDFKNQPFTTSYPAALYGWTTTDARGNTTTYEREAILGALRKITYPPTDPSGTPATREYTFTNPSYPWFHSGEKDENGHWTYFDRDGNNRVWQTRHPDGSTEQFTYNNFGQVLTHKLRSGGWENFRYDTRGRKTLSWPPSTPSDPYPEQHPTVYTYYEPADGHPSWIDRLKSVRDPLNHTTAYEYNQRGQVTKVTHNDATYTQSGYNLDGTLAWTADENHPNASWNANERTRYEYDEYKRVRKVTNPLGQTTENWYGLDANWQNPLLHTTNSLKYTLSPMSKNVVYAYDGNLRKTHQCAAMATADEAWTIFEYDEVGNLTRTTDSRGKPTAFGYDQRNRKIWMDNAMPGDRNSNGHTMEWKYDGVGNKLKEIRADNAFRSWQYNIPSRITYATDWRLSEAEPAITTTYWRNVTSTEETVTDAKNAVYRFSFDALGRKTSEIYPPAFGNANPTERFWYDEAGNLSMYQNPAGQVKRFWRDERNRPRHSWWDGHVGPDVVTTFDAASRVVDVTTYTGGVNVETFVAFGYDDANRQVWEEQTLAGYPTRRIETPRDEDGNRRKLDTWNGGYRLNYDYNHRNELFHLRGDDPFATFTRDPAGNVTQVRLDWALGAPTNYTYDELNRVATIDHGNATALFQHNHYQYDKAGRQVATWRDEDGKGERFWYNSANHLTRVVYKANNVWTGSPSNWDTFRDYNYTPDMLNWTSVNANGYLSPRASNAMNQYTNVNSFVPSYDGNFNQTTNYHGQTFVYNAANQVVGGSIQATYDGLGRCVRRIVGGVTTLFTYDNWNPIMEWDQAGNWKAVNVYGAKADEILARVDVIHGPMSYKRDRQGNITFLLGGSTQIIEKYTYDAFGRPTVTSWNYQTGTWKVPSDRSSFGNHFMFTGREWFPEINAYDYRHRLYDPDLGRFLQTDPLGLQTEGVKLSVGQKALFWAGKAPEAFTSSELNLYRYCGDDPVDGSDPLGLLPPAPGLMDVSKETLRAIWAEHVKNVQEATKPGNWQYLPGGKILKPEYGTIQQRHNGKLQQPVQQKGDFVGPNHQPVTNFTAIKGKGWTTDHISHVHTTMAGRHYDQDIPTAERLRTISAVGTTFDNGKVIELYVPREKGGGRGGFFYSTGPDNLTNLHNRPVPH